MTESTGFPDPDTPAPVPVADQRAAGVPPEETVTLAEQAAGTPPPPLPDAPPAEEPGPVVQLDLPHGTPVWLADLLQSFHERLHDLGG